MPSSFAFRRWPGWFALIPLVSLADGSMTPQPMIKLGTCPSGYSTSGQYCMPRPQARLALERRGQCPTGYGSSGAYCLATPQARPAVPKIGSSCPSGWSTSGDYCLQNR
jgi:hypothetical protein